MKHKSKQRKRKHTTATKPRGHEKMPSEQKKGSAPWAHRAYYKTSIGVYAKVKDQSVNGIN
jgi:hypothetical protein